MNNDAPPPPPPPRQARPPALFPGLRSKHIIAILIFGYVVLFFNHASSITPPQSALRRNHDKLQQQLRDDQTLHATTRAPPGTEDDATRPPTQQRKASQRREAVSLDAPIGDKDGATSTKAMRIERGSDLVVKKNPVADGGDDVATTPAPPVAAVDAKDGSLEALKRELQQQIKKEQAHAEVEALRARLRDVQEARRNNERLAEEYEWAEEMDRHRERERQWHREKWAMSERDHRQQLRGDAPPNGRGGRQLAEPEPQDTKPPSDDGTPADENYKMYPSDCPQMKPVFFEPYANFKAGLAQTENAYVTFVSSSEFVLAAAVLMFSIGETGSRYPRCVCVTKSIGQSDRNLLTLFADVVEIDLIETGHEIENDRYRTVFTKLNIWQLTMYTKIVYIDTDVAVLRNLDDLFDLNEWTVPMDAENGRYSTGMMVAEPSRTTFNQMMAALNTTTVSMELPDLNFLKEFFENTTKHINIMPRWYQVYQEEFGEQRRSYLTGRAESVTIFDNRIHGIHYPGVVKPWQKLNIKIKKYSAGYCGNRDKFRYEPQFQWYVLYMTMKTAMASVRSELMFEYERGSSIVVLKDYLAKMEEQAKAQNARSSSGWNTSPRDELSGGDEYANTVEVWQPMQCRVRASNTSWVDLSSLPPLVVWMPQLWRRNPPAELYYWVVTWCTATKIRPQGHQPCGASAFAAQYSDGMCRTNWDKGPVIKVVRGTSALGRRTVAGVVVRSWVQLEEPTRMKWMEVAVRCDPSMAPGTVLPEHNTTAVHIRDVQGVDTDRVYSIRARSRCACEGGCTDDARFKSWARSSDDFGSRCVQAHRNRTQCMRMRPLCRFESITASGSNKPVCQPQNTMWLKLHGGERGLSASCKHAWGKSGDLELSECQKEAARHDGNVINFKAISKTENACFVKTCEPSSVLSAKLELSELEGGYDVYMLNPFREYTEATTAPPTDESGTTTTAAPSDAKDTGDDTNTPSPPERNAKPWVSPFLSKLRGSSKASASPGPEDDDS